MKVDIRDIHQKWFADDAPQNFKRPSASIGAGADGAVTIERDIYGIDADDYKVSVVIPEEADEDDLSVVLDEKTLTIYLSTGDSEKASTTIGSGANGTVSVEVDEAGVAGNAYTIAVAEGLSGGNLGAALNDTDITVTLGMTSAVKASTTIGTGEHGAVDIEVDTAGDSGNDFTVSVDATLLTLRPLSATLTEDALAVVLATEGNTKASTTIGSGDNGVVTIEVDAAGTGGNTYTVEVVNGETYAAVLTESALVVTVREAGDSAESISNLINSEVGNTFSATFSNTGADLLTTPEESKNFIGGTNKLTTAANTATLVADAINDGTVGLTATASGEGTTALALSEAIKNFEGGLDPAPDNAKNTATLITDAITALTGVTATKSGTGDDPISAVVVKKNFTGGSDFGVNTAGNKVSLIATAINTVDGFIATASGTGADSISLATTEDVVFTDGQFGTPAPQIGIGLQASDYYYISTKADNTQYNDGWRRFTLADY